jgi:hypothetical protein
MHVPAMHRSAVVHALPSSQAVASATFPTGRHMATPLPQSMVPTWQASGTHDPPGEQGGVGSSGPSAMVLSSPVVTCSCAASKRGPPPSPEFVSPLLPDGAGPSGSLASDGTALYFTDPANSAVGRPPLP